MRSSWDAPPWFIVMPQSVTFDLPLIVAGSGGFSLVRPIGFPEIALASANEVAAVHAVQRRVIKICRDYLGADLVVRMVRGQVQRQVVVVEILPPQKTNAWRDKIDVLLDSFVWQQDDALVITYLPALDLTVVASPHTDIDKLVAEQVRSAIRRNDDWTLPGLAKLDRLERSTLRHESITVLLPTPIEHARKQDEKPRSKTPTLNAVATRLRGPSLRPAFHRDSDVQALGRLLAADGGRSVLLVGPSGVGKTAIFHQWVREAESFGMKDVQCWATDGSRLISGQTGFGMWQQQCLAMADEAARYRSIIHLGNLVRAERIGTAPRQRWLRGVAGPTAGRRQHDRRDRMYARATDADFASRAAIGGGADDHAHRRTNPRADSIDLAGSCRRLATDRYYG